MISMRVTELLRLTTTSGRTYLIVNQLDTEGLEVIWKGFTPQGIFKAGMDMVTELMVKHRPAFLVFNVLEHNTTDELQRYATAALLEYPTCTFRIENKRIHEAIHNHCNGSFYPCIIIMLNYIVYCIKCCDDHCTFGKAQYNVYFQ